MKMHLETMIDGNVLRGYFETPDNSAGKVPLIVIYHGFTGDCTENNFILTRLSKKLCEIGIATVRLSYPGSGESDGDFSEVSPKVWGNISKKIFEFSSMLPGIDLDRMGIAGLSMGGAASAIAASELKDSLKLLILIAPAFRYATKYEKLFNNSDMAYKGSLMIKKQFVDDEKNTDYSKILSEINAPVYFIHGTEDTSVSFDVSKEFAKYPQNSKLIPVLGATHSFDSIKAFNDLINEVVDAAGTLLTMTE